MYCRDIKNKLKLINQLKNTKKLFTEGSIREDGGGEEQWMDSSSGRVYAHSFSELCRAVNNEERKK